MFDKEKTVKAVCLFLEGIGEDLHRDGLKNTPQRIASMWEKFIKKSLQSTTDVLNSSFHVENYNGTITLDDIPFYSFCEHHILPFFGIVSISYTPSGNRVIGISKFARIVNILSSKLQIQERLTQEIAEAIVEQKNVKNVTVKIIAEHMCVNMRGARAGRSKTITECALCK